MSESTSLAKWSSLELLPEEEDSPPAGAQKKSAEDSIFSHNYLQRVASERTTRRATLGTTSSIDRQDSPPGSPGLSNCKASYFVESANLQIIPEKKLTILCT